MNMKKTLSREVENLENGKKIISQVWEVETADSIFRFECHAEEKNGKLVRAKGKKLGAVKK